MTRAKKTRLMAQLKLFKAPKPLRVAPITILIVSLIIGIILGGVAADTLLRERVEEPVELREGERPERSTTLVGIKEDEEEPILVKLTVQLIENGRGRILLDITPARFREDTQQSAENAWEAVVRVFGYDLSNLDVVFILEGKEKFIVKGPSAGAAMAVTLYALVRSVYENKSWVVDNAAVVSAMITSGGEIMPVGDIELKAQKVWQEGFKRFVVSWHQKFLHPQYPSGLEIVEVRDLEDLADVMVIENTK